MPVNAQELFNVVKDGVRTCMITDTICEVYDCRKCTFVFLANNMDTENDENLNPNNSENP